MADREKVIKGLEACLAAEVTEDENPCESCPYFFDEMCQSAIKKDALALLKEQEAKTVELIQMDRNGQWGADLTGYCPSCKRPLKSRFSKRFCGECGQAVKWDD